MKAKQWLVGLLFFVLLVITQAQAALSFYSGNKLVELMREFDSAETRAAVIDYAKAREFSAYIVGVLDATRQQYGFPDELTVGQVSHIVAKYLKSHPERWSETASNLVISALQEAFPKLTTGLEMGPFGRNVRNGGKVHNVPVSHISSVPSYTFHETTSP